MLQLDLKSRKSIYEQIVDGIKEMIVAGVYRPGDKIPSVRELSAELTVNPNTIQKSLRQLESQGWIYTVPGRGSFVSESGKSADSGRAAEIYDKIVADLDQLRYLGESREQILGKLTEILEKRGKRNDPCGKSL